MAPDLKEQILDLIYDLLPEDQAESLRVRIETEPDVRAIYDSFMKKSRLLKEAARLEPEKSLFPVVTVEEQELETSVTSVTVTHYGKSTQYIHSPHPKKQGFRRITREIARRALGEERGINRMISFGAIGLILLSFLGYVFQKQQVNKLSEQSYLYRIVAPPVLVNDQTQSLQIQVSDLVGRPQQIPVRVAVNTLEGEKIFAQTQKTDSQGNMLVNLDTQKDLPAEVELEVFLGENPDKKIVSRLPVLQKESQFAVALDKPIYTPEDHVRYRAFNMSQSVPASEHKKTDQILARRNGASSQQSQETHLETLNVWISNENPEDVPSLEDATTGESVPEGMEMMSGFTPGREKSSMSGISTEIAGGMSGELGMGSVSGMGGMSGMGGQQPRQVYSLQNTVQIPVDPSQHVTTGSLPLDNPPVASSRSTLQLPSASSMSAPQELKDSIETHKEQASTPMESLLEPPSKPVDHDLIVEWVPGGGRLVLGLENTVYFKSNRHFKGNLVDQTGKIIVPVETGSDNYGEFRWTPKSGNSYQLQLSGEELSDRRIPLDLKYESLPVSLDIEQAVLASDQTLAANLNARQNDIPVIVTVVKQGIPILAQARILSRGLNMLEIPLPTDAHGLLDVLVFDGTSDTQPPLAWQSVFRHPNQYLDINVKSKVTSLQNDNASWNFDLRILNESGKPAAYAAVGVNIIQDRTNNEISRDILSQQMTLTDQFFFPSLSVENWEQFDTLIRIPQEDPEPDATSRLKFLLAKDRSDLSKIDGQTLAAIHPLVYDNFSQLQSQYHEKVLHFQNARNSWMRGFMIISIFGGMGFAVLVMILVTMRLASAVRMFVLTAIVGLSCVFLCLAMLKNQVNVSEAFQKVSFVSHKMKEMEVLSLKDNIMAENAPQALSMQQDQMIQHQNQIQSPQIRRPIQALHSEKNVFPNFPSTVSFENIFWQPELKTDAQGRVAFDFLITGTENSAIQVMIDAFDENGRIGSCRIHLPADKKTVQKEE